MLNGFSAMTRYIGSLSFNFQSLGGCALRLSGSVGTRRPEGLCAVDHHDVAIIRDRDGGPSPTCVPRSRETFVAGDSWAIAIEHVSPRRPIAVPRQCSSARIDHQSVARLAAWATASRSHPVRSRSDRIGSCRRRIRTRLPRKGAFVSSRFELRTHRPIMTR